MKKQIKNYKDIFPIRDEPTKQMLDDAKQIAGKGTVKGKMKDLLTGIIIHDNISDELMLFEQNWTRKRYVLDRYNKLSARNKVKPLTGRDKELLEYFAERRKVYIR